MTAKIWDTTPAALIALHTVAAALAHVGVVVLVSDREMRVVVAHGAAECCVGVNGIGGSVLEGMPLATHDAWRAAHAAVVGGASHAALEVERRDQAGVSYIAFDLSRLPTADPKELYVVCVGRDVTAQRRAEHHEQHSMALAVHELRTPLTALKGYAQLAFTRSEADSQYLRRMLQLINLQADRLSQTLDKWADLVGMQQGKLRLVWGPVDLVALVRDVVRVRQYDLSDRIIRVHGDGSITVAADRQRLHHALGLLLDTAIKYSPTNSPVDILVNQTSATAQIVVHEHGVRIPAAQHAWVWEPWYEAPAETRRALGGMGLRLHAVKQIVERHGGSVGVEPGANNGNVWRLRLPLAASSSGHTGETT